MAEYRDVYVLAEVSGSGNISQWTLELLGLGGSLAAELGERLRAVVLGDGVSGVAEELSRYGVERVLVGDHPSLREYNPDLYTAVLENLFKGEQPSAILASHSSVGQDLLPRLAFALGTGLVTDCLGIRVDGRSSSLLFEKQIYGGNALATMRIKRRPQTATVRARVGDVPPAGEAGEISGLDVSLPEQTRIELKETILEEKAQKLEEARVVVSGGRGIGGPEGFEKLAELARLLEGAVGASRPPCDAGWIQSTNQVGITGKIVAPDIYIAVAISGSSQHVSGMSESCKVVAINQDRDANIFKVADYGALGDWRKVLPAFSGKLKVILDGSV